MFGLHDFRNNAVICCLTFQKEVFVEGPISRLPNQTQVANCLLFKGLEVRAISASSARSYVCD